VQIGRFRLDSAFQFHRPSFAYNLNSLLELVLPLLRRQVDSSLANTPSNTNRLRLDDPRSTDHFLRHWLRLPPFGCVDRQQGGGRIPTLPPLHQASSLRSLTLGHMCFHPQDRHSLDITDPPVLSWLPTNRPAEGGLLPASETRPTLRLLRILETQFPRTVPG
jgi:hypothetical protein